jgi:hypothetical protein
VTRKRGRKEITINIGMPVENACMNAAPSTIPLSKFGGVPLKREGLTNKVTSENDTSSSNDIA